VPDFRHGRNTSVWLGAFDVSSYCNAADLSADVDTAESTTFGNDWHRFLPGAAGLKVDVKGVFDPAAAPYFTDVIQTEPVLTYGPAGMAAIGDLARLVLVNETAYAESTPVGGVVGFTCAMLADGQVGFGQVVHILEAETADGDGGLTDYVDLGTAAADAVAHLHVTSVSAGDSIVVKLQDASDAGFSDVADVTGGGFASAAAASAERLTVAGTVRRYVRASWDVTGTDVSITFAVAVARLP
jgi:hypothetical protein